MVSIPSSLHSLSKSLWGRMFMPNIFSRLIEAELCIGPEGELNNNQGLGLNWDQSDELNSHHGLNNHRGLNRC